MGKQLLDFDADTGVAHYTEVDDIAGTMALQSQLDAEPMVEANKAHRLHGDYDHTPKDGVQKYCDVDDVLILKMLKKGINILRPTNQDWTNFFREIETNYPFYKVTNKKAWMPHK